jgi:hypothetical protein
MTATDEIETIEKQEYSADSDKTKLETDVVERRRMSNENDQSSCSKGIERRRTAVKDVGSKDDGEHHRRTDNRRRKSGENVENDKNHECDEKAQLP